MENFANLLSYLENNDPFFSSLIGSILSAPEKHYRSFKIPKKRGGLRLITSPYPSLNNVQQVIFQKTLSSIEAHSNSYAFTKNRNAICHASRHLKCEELLTLDIKDFFQNITRQMVFEVFDSNSSTKNLANFLSRICCLNGSIPQGACTSPALSNLIFKHFDERFLKLANSLNLEYSRYADDMAFSGETIPRNLPKLVQSILSEKNFQLNPDKIKLKIKGAKKIITGVSISSGVAKAPKIFKRTLRAQVYELEKNVADLSSLPKFDPFIYERVLGRLNYILQIEPNNQYAKSKKKQITEQHQKFLKLAIILD